MVRGSWFVVRGSWFVVRSLPEIHSICSFLLATFSLRCFGEDDLPAGGGFFEDVDEGAVGVAAGFFGAGEAVGAGGDGEGVAEGADFDLGLLEGSHGVAVGEAGVEAGADGGEAAEGCAEDGLGVGGVFVEGEIGVEVGAVPGGFLGEEDLGDVELEAGGGEELVGGLGVGGQWGDEGEGEEEFAHGASVGGAWLKSGSVQVRAMRF